MNKHSENLVYFNEKFKKLLEQNAYSSLPQETFEQQNLLKTGPSIANIPSMGKFTDSTDKFVVTQPNGTLERSDEQSQGKPISQFIRMSQNGQNAGA